jgi:three-Cys-motif partner protein
MKKLINSKKTMLIHSEAKVEFFKTYLERYLRILYLAHGIDEINIFDVFCGTGIYENGKKGSPIVAFDAVKKLRNDLGFDKRINLIVNDSQETKVSAVRDYIDSNNKNYCEVGYHKLPAEMMFEEVIKHINKQTRNSRNLVFIDPYGYKEIKKATLERLLQNERTEIILFLPISQMQRFTAVALENDLEPYKPLRNFVDSFFEENHPIKTQRVSAIQYIDFLKKQLRFGKYFSTSYYIARDESSFFGLFFISPHIFGFQKILEVKWALDEEGGRGFRQPEPQSSLFAIQSKELAHNDNYERLEKILKNSLQTPKDNWELYEIILENEFLPKHANEIFKNWQDKSKIISVTEINTGKAARKNSFYVNWENYKNNAGNPKVTFTLL